MYYFEILMALSFSLTILMALLKLKSSYVNIFLAVKDVARVCSSIQWCSHDFYIEKKAPLASLEWHVSHLFRRCNSRIC